MSAGPSQAQSSVTATQLVRDFPEVRRLAEKGPVRVTSHGRTDVVVLTPEQYAELTAGSQTDPSPLEWKLSLILDSIETHVLILDQDLRIKRVNRFFADTSSIPMDELIGRSLSTLIHKPSDQFILQRLNEVLRSGQPETFVVPSPQYEGRMIRVTMKTWPGGVALFAEDVTERETFRDKKIADHAIDASLDALGGLGVAQVQSNGTILSSSVALANMVGSPANTLTGARLQNLFDPGCRSVISDALKDGTSESRCYDVRYLRRGVEVVPAVLSVTPYWTAEHHACAAAVLHDPAFTITTCESKTRAA